MEEALRLFGEVYPDATATAEKIESGVYLITADFPDGRFYFIVDTKENLISSGKEDKENILGTYL